MTASAQEPRKWNYRAVDYRVTATLLPEDQTLNASATVEFEALQASRIVEVELHPNLRVNSIKGGDGKAVTFERDPADPLRVRITLDQAVAVGGRVSLNFEYSGILANEESSPVKDTRVAYIGKDGCYLLPPGRWFPLTDFPGNRFTATFSMVVPQGLAIVGSGRMAGPTPAAPSPAAPKGGAPAPARPSAAREVYTFTVDKPQAAGAFVAGKMTVLPVRAEGTVVPVYIPERGLENATQYAQSLANILEFFSSEFGPLPNASVALGVLPEGSLPGYSTPGLILLGERQWTAQTNYKALARLAAALWWGNEVQAATPNDTWLTDGLSRYSEAMYVWKQAGEEGFNRTLEEFAIGAITYEDAAPIAQAGRLPANSSEYSSVVVNKGALVFNMLRSQMGDDLFRTLLREFHARFAGKSAGIEDFQKLTQLVADSKATETSPATNYAPFFVNWLNSTGLPEMKLEYVVIRLQKGFRVTGKVKQNLETFKMPVELRVLTEGNPETRTIEVVGTDSDFTIETFGRPRPNGIILDPNNKILKSNPKLRVRSAIARGEQLAEQGRYYDAVQEYQRALDLQKNNSLASFRMGEGFFYQKNYQAAANAFRDALDGDLDSSYRWVEVWSHIYIGKIFDVSGQRERAVNEYNKARETNDNTGNAQAEIEKLIKEPFKG